MSNLAKLRDSKENIEFEDFKEKLIHNINSRGFIKPQTIIDIIDRLDLNINDLNLLLAIIKDGMQKYSSRKLERELESLKNLSKKIEEKIRLFGISKGIRTEVDTLIFPKQGRRASRKARVLEMQLAGVNQTKENRRKENLSRFPIDTKIEEVKVETTKKVYNLIELPEEESKVIFGAYKYFKKLISQKYITKSEIMGLKDFFERATVFLDRFGGVSDYKKINNLKNRLKTKTNKCGSRILSQELQEDYEKFMQLISL